MKKFEVTLTYTRPSGTPTHVTYDVERPTRAQAKRAAKDELLSDPRRKVSRIIDTAVVDMTPEPAPEPDLIRNGETITLPREPLVGRVRFRTDRDDIVDIVKINGGFAPIRRAVVERLTGRKLEPAPRRTVTKVISIYPDEAFFQDRPVRNSSLGVENLVQVRVVRDAVTNELISKEFV